jgi:hypothetical protein
MHHQNDLSKILTKWLKQMEIEYNTKVKYFRCDNAGENTKFQEAISVIRHYILSLQPQFPLNQMVKKFA